MDSSESTKSQASCVIIVAASGDPVCVDESGCVNCVIVAHLIVCESIQSASMRTLHPHCGGFEARVGF